MHHRALLLALLASIVLQGPLHAQSSPAVQAAPSTLLAQSDKAAALTTRVRAELIDAIAAQLAANYVDEPVSRQIIDYLRTRLRAGAYDALDNPAQFAEQLTRDLRAANGDLHLAVRYSPLPQQTGEQPPLVGGPLPASAAAAPRPDVVASQRQNYGVEHAEILEGNVGYLEIRGFDGNDGYETTVVEALRFLSRTDALIIDLRRNGGGSSEMSHFLFSHFLPATPVATIRVASRMSPEPQTFHSLADVPGPRRPNLPLFLLTSRNTASAAEEFTFVLANQHRASVVGSRTAGAGHMVQDFAVGHGFVVGVSITRVIDPASGLEWEGAGVQPTIAAAPEQALIEAHAAALRQIVASNTDPERRKVLARQLLVIEAQRRPQVLDLNAARGMVGQYEGREVSLHNGQLTYGRIGGLPVSLVALGGNRFGNGSTQYEFDDAGGHASLTVETADGSRIRLVRSERTVQR